MKLGIDVGRVLISAEAEGTKGDTSFIGGTLEHALATPPYEGMFEAVPELVKLFGGQVWLVSKARSRVQEKTLAWLLRHRFYERTGIPQGNVRFCIERHQKADHCRELGLTHFIDDRTDVLHHLEGIVPNLFLFGPQKIGTVIRHGVIPTVDWDVALRKVRDSVVSAAEQCAAQ